MALHRRAAKRDQAEALIVEALRKRGWSVLKHSSKDGPDLVCARWDGYQRTVAVEVKTGKRKLKPGQEAWIKNWPGETAILRTVDEALAL